jgi:hypothetical protein
MPTIQFEGQTHVFPDDFSDADISKALGGGQSRPDLAQNPPSVQRPQVDMQPSMFGSAASVSTPNTLTQGRQLASQAYGGNASDVQMRYSSDPSQTTPHLGGQISPSTDASNAAMAGGAVAAPFTGGLGLLTRLGLMGAGAGAGSTAAQLATTGKVDPTQTAGDITKFGTAQELGGTALKAATGSGLSAAKGILNAISKVAPESPVNLNATLGPLQAIINESKAGGTPPKVVNDLIERIKSMDKEPLSFSEARRFYQNASKSSIPPSEVMDLNANMKRLLGNFREGLHQDILANRSQVGLGNAYNEGIQQYANAAQTERGVSNAAKIGGASAVSGVTGYTGYRIAKAITGGR